MHRSSNPSNERVFYLRFFVQINSSMALLFILFIAFCCPVVNTQDNFYFSITPESMDIIEGNDVVLHCDVSKKRDITFYWTLDGNRLTNTSRRYQHGSNLHIQRVNHTLDTGIFHCIATNVSSGYSLKSSEAVLNILWIIPEAEVQLRRPSPNELGIGKDMRLRCYVTGNPEPTYYWFKNDVPLTSNAHIVVRDNVLIVNKLESADAGVYSCQASNEAGYITSMNDFLLHLPNDEPNAVNLDTSTFSKTLIVKESSNAFLHCEFSNVIRTEWYFKSARLIRNSRYLVFSNGTLKIGNIRPQDEGAYVCRGVGRVSSQEFSTQLFISKLADFTESSFEPRLLTDFPFVVAQGKQSKIVCIVPRGVPEPTYYWENPNGARVPTSGRIYADHTVLYITNAEPSDVGQYSCVAENLSGKKRGRINLVISIPPLITKNPVFQQVMEGAPASFSCSFKGSQFPVSQVLWYHNDKPLPGRSRYTLRSDKGTLDISKTSMVDEGRYKCVINTTAQDIKSSKSAKLEIIRKLKFTSKPVSQKILERGNISKLTCQAEGPITEPNPTVYWMLSNGSSLPPHVKDKQGVLVFEPVKNSDRGNYSCIASSSSQGTITTNVSVDVVVRPKFDVAPRNTTAYEGFPVMIHCLSIGDPPPRTRWDKNSNFYILQDDPRFQVLKNGSLSITQVYLSDRGWFGCTAGNSGGLVRKEMYLDVQTTDEYLMEMKRKQVESQSMLKTVIIAVCSAVAYLGLVIGLTICCSLRMLRSRRMNKAMYAKNETEMDNKECDDLHEQERTLIEDKASTIPERTNFPRSDLQTLGMLGKGSYGDVFLAKAKGIIKSGVETQVLVKSLLNANNTYHQLEFKRQMDMFRKAEHENVVKLLAVCADVEPHLLILEYCDWGDLKQFLRAMQRDNGRNVKVPPLTPWQKVAICSQISSGMEKISSMGLVHKDLATRNVLLCPNLDVKISHLGLCRDVYASEYYELGGRLVPIRWLPPECLKNPDRWTPKSDVWMFGTLCFEVFSLGDIPYRHEADEDVIDDVISGHLKPQFPANLTPPVVRDIMSKCFLMNPEDRHSFAVLTKLLREFVESEVDV